MSCGVPMRPSGGVVRHGGALLLGVPARLQRRQRHAGADRVGADTLAGKLHGQRLGERADAGLRGLVGVLRLRIAAIPLDGREVHHGAAAAAGAHLGHDSARRVHEGFQIDVEDLVPDIEVHLQRRLVAAEPQHAGDIGEMVDAATLAAGRADRVFDEGGVGQVALREGEPVAVGAKGCRARLDVDGGDGGAGIEQRQRDRFAHATAGPGDDRMPAGEIIDDHSLPLFVPILAPGVIVRQ